MGIDVAVVDSYNIPVPEPHSVCISGMTQVAILGIAPPVVARSTGPRPAIRLSGIALAASTSTGWQQHSSPRFPCKFPYVRSITGIARPQTTTSIAIARTRQYAERFPEEGRNPGPTPAMRKVNISASWLVDSGTSHGSQLLRYMQREEHHGRLMSFFRGCHWAWTPACGYINCRRERLSVRGT